MQCVLPDFGPYQALDLLTISPRRHSTRVLCRLRLRGESRHVSGGIKLHGIPPAMLCRHRSIFSTCWTLPYGSISTFSCTSIGSEDRQVCPLTIAVWEWYPENPGVFFVCVLLKHSASGLCVTRSVDAGPGLTRL
uniref:AlNc14C173G8058 protein n=1 Tax=Albugo laibachii Nc14 TaxID=890382 RepID=F0WNN7_9STRA|nr:AlNc14C173G8058 [Albugo laibachii Nc14]|eukprot:CCA22928.1 AlNc14C173G8058 [Albugo laibachii Nc14]